MTREPFQPPSPSRRDIGAGELDTSVERFAKREIDVITMPSPVEHLVKREVDAIKLLYVIRRLNNAIVCQTNYDPRITGLNFARSKYLICRILWAYELPYGPADIQRVLFRVGETIELVPPLTALAIEAELNSYYSSGVTP